MALTRQSGTSMKLLGELQGVVRHETSYTRRAAEFQTPAASFQMASLRRPREKRATHFTLPTETLTSLFSIFVLLKGESEHVWSNTAHQNAQSQRDSLRVNADAHRARQHVGSGRNTTGKAPQQGAG